MKFYMAISASFNEPRKRKFRKNRKDLFDIVVARINEIQPSKGGENLLHLKVGYIPSHIYESIPINGVDVDRFELGNNTYSVFQSINFKVQTQEQANDIIEMLNNEYQVIK
ncbi:hypothetical protein HC026_02090 [Lactobacillus sp. LC28-10]|uniref:Uncharacterized protein n=1 Tax=Secundilactobacillus angelensis TaxID=2722706 RepID=A0ABX1KWK7_9LACO|nr:hypothetical protein [Secundilactobacillus angelensis]MCH5461482.1 hypothetical protein [Secundilactobacillus angelensis]NLR17705.1 hypothetical protein [Secundilactobacillus angelensis]